MGAYPIGCKGNPVKKNTVLTNEREMQMVIQMQGIVHKKAFIKKKKKEKRREGRKLLKNSFPTK